MKEIQNILNACYKYSRMAKEKIFRSGILSYLFLLAIPYMIEELEKKVKIKEKEISFNILIEFFIFSIEGFERILT